MTAQGRGETRARVPVDADGARVVLERAIRAGLLPFPSRFRGSCRQLREWWFGLRFLREGADFAVLNHFVLAAVGDEVAHLLFGVGFWHHLGWIVGGLRGDGEFGSGSALVALTPSSTWAPWQ